MRCKLCNRRAVKTTKFCEYHRRAHEELGQAYEKWKFAYGDLSWIAYLHRVVKLEEVGLWVKAVAELELKIGGPEES